MFSNREGASTVLGLGDIALDWFRRARSLVRVILSGDYDIQDPQTKWRHGTITHILQSTALAGGRVMRCNSYAAYRGCKAAS